MGYYAYEDIDRKIDITAKEAAKKDISISYYCPNPVCGAHLHVCSVNGSMSAHFRATLSKHRHIPGCLFGEHGSYSPEDSDEDSFNFENIINGLMKPAPTKSTESGISVHGSEASEIKPLHTLLQVYRMCKAHLPRDTYNGLPMGKMLLCDKSAYFWPKGIYGPLIIEGMCRKRFYDPDKKEIYLTAPIKNNNYNLVLRFGNLKAFMSLKDQLFHNRNKIIIVGGIWKYYGIYGTFCTEIISRKQYKVLNEIII